MLHSASQKVRHFTVTFREGVASLWLSESAALHCGSQRVQHFTVTDREFITSQCQSESAALQSGSQKVWRFTQIEKQYSYIDNLKNILFCICWTESGFVSTEKNYIFLEKSVRIPKFCPERKNDYWTMSANY